LHIFRCRHRDAEKIMRKVLLGTAALIALLSSPAISADMQGPLYKAAPPVVAIWSCAGCYVGGHAGGLWASKKEWTVQTPGGDFFGQSLGGHHADSWLGGVQAVATINLPAAS